MKNLSKKDLIFISLMTFSLFFGAGNLIFPPFLGKLAGNSTWIALGGFLISAVGFPILAIVTISKAGGLHALASRVHIYFAVVFTIIIYLAIGPFLGIPRAGSLAFEMGVAPFLPSSISSSKLALFIYTLCYFLIAFWLCLTPSKLVDRFGKILTPILLVLISTIFICSLFKPIGPSALAQGNYVESPAFKGFLDGYMTMDAIAALNFGIVISIALKAKGIQDEKSITSNSIKAGLIAGLFLTIIYGMLAYLGASSQIRFPNTQNGAEILTNIVLYLFGKPGAVLLGIIFSLACLTTSVGLITSCSQYFTRLIPKVSYKTWVKILCSSSMVFANMGLTKILSISVPVLTAIYPVALTLIVLSLANDFFGGSSSVYRWSLLFVSFVSIIDSLKEFGFKLDFLINLFNYLPLYSKGLGWLVPAVIGALVGFIISLPKRSLVNVESN
ncbi:branched-chain amino acid transport system II carrier protein [Clostridium sp. MB40-C1]|uniref:branched-chain amino acid transport system II carrier protein n=1 Tax=Clostridium sp. MB40-C1 TaxID=3070996 RepID=UPI0027E097CC|nr:branched-chain amino acid transport system II carrier protein [Clostridium sp. MB40-C1]WMJ80550.1 branched-chain amino acid transport system II carrier protein [Clostridium sp. MB40-C1]